MKNWIIGALVGAIIIFAWQFVSHAVADLHRGSTQYHPQQDQILQNLSSVITEDGAYYMPNLPAGASMDEHERLMKEMDGKPMAWVMYKKSASTDMVTPMIRGFLVDLSLVLLFIFIFTRVGVPSFGSIFISSLAIGLFTFLWNPYMMMVWFQVPWETVQGDFIDALVAWGLCGLWLGWFLNRKRNVRV